MVFLQNQLDIESLNLPAINADHAFEGVSKRYNFIDTKSIVSKFIENGWIIKAATQQGVHGGEANPRFGYQKHRIQLLQPHQKLDVLEKGELFPSLELINSHDGKGGATKINFGFLRLACLNGLLVATDQNEELRLSHAAAGDWQQWQEVILNLTDRYASVAKTWDKTVSNQKKLNIAKEALVLRLGEDYDRVDPDEVLSPLRGIDKTDTLWGVYNVLQERLTTGNFRMSWGKEEEHKTRKARPLVDIHRNTVFQKGLWQIVSNAA